MQDHGPEAGTVPEGGMVLLAVCWPTEGCGMPRGAWGVWDAWGVWGVRDAWGVWGANGLSGSTGGVPNVVVAALSRGVFSTTHYFETPHAHRKTRTKLRPELVRADTGERVEIPEDLAAKTMKILCNDCGNHFEAPFSPFGLYKCVSKEEEPDGPEGPEGCGSYNTTMK